MRAYHFRTDWAFKAPLATVWSVVLDIEHYPAWWSNFRRVRVRRGDGKSAGSVIDCEVRGSLPYSLNYALEVMNADPMRSIDLRSTGDLVGTGRWEFAEKTPRDILATYFWDVGTPPPARGSNYLTESPRSSPARQAKISLPLRGRVGVGVSGDSVNVP